MNLRLFHRAWKARYRDQRHEIRAALSFIQPDDTVADVGANKGAYLYWLCKAVGTQGKVFGFEPQPSLFNYLQQTASCMKWNNVVLKNCALSDSAGIRKLFVPAENSPGATLEAVAAQAEGLGFSCDCQADTLDNQLQNATAVSFLKVDVEGHELQVFRGAKKTIAQHTPAILFECEARHLRHHTMQDVFAFLQGLDYRGAFFSPKDFVPCMNSVPKFIKNKRANAFGTRLDTATIFYSSITPKIIPYA